MQMASALPSCWNGKEVSSETSVIVGETMSINDLPDEIVLMIVSHIAPEDLCFVIPKVCEKWNRLSKDGIIWKTQSYCCDDHDISCVAEVLTGAPALQSLTIHRRNDAVHILKILFDSHVDIRKLILTECNLGIYASVILTNITTLYPNLEALSLKGCRTIPSADYFLITRLKKLSELNLSYCKEVNRTTARLIVDSCQHLKKLNLGEACRIVDDEAIHVIKKLGKQLTALFLNGTYLTDVVYLYLNKCARLQELGLSYCENMTDRGLLEGIGSLQELTSLRLKVCPKLTAQALSTFLHQPSMTSVVSLDLSCCFNLNNEGLKGIAKRCVRLKELVVGCADVTDAGISMVIRNCNQLRLLNLWALKYITGDGWLALVHARLPHLRVLCYNYSRGVRDEYIEELVAAVPELVVVNSDGTVVGGMGNKQLEAAYNKLDPYQVITPDAYDIIRQWALDR